jgi:hypothetical protein
MQPTTGKARSYSHQLIDIAAGTHAEITKVAQAQFEQHAVLPLWVWLVRAAATWFSNKVEQSAEQQTGRRSLFGVIAKASPWTTAASQRSD